jgi:hypothetical protein
MSSEVKVPKSISNGVDRDADRLTEAVGQILSNVEPYEHTDTINDAQSENNDDRYYDPEYIRSAPNYAESVSLNVTNELLVRRPNKLAPMRIHPSPTYRVFTHFVELRDENEIYLVAPELVAQAPPGVLTGATLVLWVNQEMRPYLMIVPEPPEKGSARKSAQSLKECVEWGMKYWIRIAWDKDIRRFQAFKIKYDMPEPKWPTEPFKQLIKRAFKDTLIKSTDHPVWRKHVISDGALNPEPEL